MTTYDTMRHFADSWMLLVLAIIFSAVVFFVFRPGAGKVYDKTSRIPLEDDEEA